MMAVKTRSKRRATYRCKSHDALLAALLHVPVEGPLTDHRYPAAHPLPGRDSPGTRSREAIRFRVLHTFPLESGGRDGL